MSTECTERIPTKMQSKLFYVEHQLGEEWVEYEYEVEIYNFEPLHPGRMYGPPEDCYPDDPASCEFNDETVQRRLADGTEPPWETVPFAIFLEGYAEKFKDDPKDKKYGKTAMTKAQDDIEQECLMHCQEAADDAYEAAMEAKGEEMRDRRMFGDDW